MRITHLIDDTFGTYHAHAFGQSMESIMKGILVTSIVLAGLLQMSPVSAEAAELPAPASVALFYDALTGAPGKDVTNLLIRATTPNWVSCGTNEVCTAREQVIVAIAGRHKLIPDLKWEIKEVIVSGDRVVVRGEASGTPAGEFMGVPHNGKSFKLMSIDVHTIEAGKLARSYHVEDWMGAIRQLSAK
jgi:hypothetical protein